MLAPRTQIALVQSAAGVTGVFLIIAATRISTNFHLLNFAIMTGLFVLAILCFFLGYRMQGIICVATGLIFSPVINFFDLPGHIRVIIDITTLAGIAYFAYWATNPYKKGTRFEQYVSTLFPEPDFVILDRTRDVSKFLNRRVESDMHPDFLFRNQKTGKSFAVECKWRGKWAQGTSGELGLWWNKSQGERYVAYEKEAGIPVFVAFGIGGSPEKPKEIYFLEANRLHYIFLPQSLIKSGKLQPEL